MKKLKIITTPDPRLREESLPVDDIDDDIKAIIAEMRRLSFEWEKNHPHELSAAMAAPQLGINKRIIIVRDNMQEKENADFIALINPKIIKTEGKTITEPEGCLSVPEIYGMVARPAKARIKATLEDGSEVKIKAEDFLARTLLYEIDHLNGILFIDHIKNNKKAFFRLNSKGDLDPIDYEKEIKNNKDLFPDS